MGRRSPRKGARIEREMVNMLRDAGIQAERVPLSGSCGGSFSGDLIIDGKYTAEVKARGTGGGFTLIDRWLEDRDVLIVKQDRKPPLMVLTFQAYSDLIQAAHLEPRVTPSVIVQDPHHQTA